MEPENHHGLVMSTFDPVQIGEVRQQSLVEIVMFLCSLSIYISLLLNLFFLWDAIRRCLRWPCQQILGRLRWCSSVRIGKPSRRHCKGMQATFFLESQRIEIFESECIVSLSLRKLYPLDTNLLPPRGSIIMISVVCWFLINASLHYVYRSINRDSALMLCTYGIFEMFSYEDYNISQEIYDPQCKKFNPNN